jgi:hypothetical protein
MHSLVHGDQAFTAWKELIVSPLKLRGAIRARSWDHVNSLFAKATFRACHMQRLSYKNNFFYAALLQHSACEYGVFMRRG